MGLLVLTRYPGESVIIGEEDYTLTVNKVDGDQVDYMVKSDSGTDHYTESDEPVYADGAINIFLVRINNKQVRFGFDCHRDISVNRREIWQRILDEREGEREVMNG